MFIHQCIDKVSSSNVLLVSSPGLPRLVWVSLTSSAGSIRLPNPSTSLAFIVKLTMANVCHVTFMWLNISLITTFSSYFFTYLG